MQKKSFLILGVLAVVLLASCQTAPTTWDYSYPEERSASVRFVSMVVTAYNGISVSNFEWVRIPEGQTSITADVFIRHAGIIFVARDMEFGFPFQAGREYRVVGTTNDMRWGVSIYDSGSNELLAFVPFIEQPQFTG